MEKNPCPLFVRLEMSTFIMEDGMVGLQMLKTPFLDTHSKKLKSVYERDIRVFRTFMESYKKLHMDFKHVLHKKSLISFLQTL